MTDKEMLELAAKAAGIEGQWVDAVGGCVGGIMLPEFPFDTWNALTNDGDALRLAVLLRFCIKDFAPTTLPDIPSFGMIEIWRESDEDPIYVEWYKPDADRNAATRRAIVRAAAEIEKTYHDQ